MVHFCIELNGIITMLSLLSLVVTQSLITMHDVVNCNMSRSATESPEDIVEFLTVWRVVTPTTVRMLSVCVVRNHQLVLCLYV